jgi:hypothetical protein
MSGLGLIPAIQTMSNVKDERFLQIGGPIVGSTLVSPISLQAATVDGPLSTKPEIYIDGANSISPAYVGAVNITPGGMSPSVGAGITIRSAAGPSTVVEVGTDTQSNNLLYIAGPSGVGQVYDEVYNQPVALQTITLTNVSPTNIVDTANPGEIFRCDQAGVLASATAAIGCTLQVPKTGFYMVAAEIKLANAPAPAPTSIVVPITVSAGFNIGETLTMSFSGPGSATTNTPYSVMDIGALDFSQDQILTVNDGPVRQYIWMQKFDSTLTYRFALRGSSALWNIGPAGQIKVELIAMC